jgi:osmoprotectant transport system substrate-binding protein
MRKLTIIVLAVVLVFALTGAGLVAEQKKVVVGNKNFTEEYIVGQLMKQILEDRGFKVELVSDLSTMALREGMVAGDIEICADYTGTAWMVHLGREYLPGINNVDLYYLVKEWEKHNDFIWLNPMWNNNTYALASWPEYAEEHNLKTLSDLAAWYNENDGKIPTFIDFEFSVRPDGLPALEEYYGFHVDEAYLKTGAPGASLLALENRQVDVAMVFGTDAAIAKNGWYVYIDDKSFFPPYDLTPYVRKDTLDKYPEIADILNELVATFPCGGEFPTDPTRLGECVAEGQKAWQQLNARVDIDKLEPDEAAHEYLVEHGLIGG